MTKNYFYITLLTLVMFSWKGFSQDTKQMSRLQESTPIEGLSLYPNPVTAGKVYITTRNDAEKDIQIFDVLGKKVMQTMLSSRELNLNSLTPGVYIIKITEEEASTTRKLIIR